MYISIESVFNARVAQWWSIALPRRGSRVRIPSRASQNDVDAECITSISQEKKYP